MYKYQVRETFHRWTTVELETDCPTSTDILQRLPQTATPEWASTDVYTTDDNGNAADLILDW